MRSFGSAVRSSFASMMPLSSPILSSAERSVGESNENGGSAGNIRPNFPWSKNLELGGASPER